MGYAVSGKTALVTGANRGIGEALVDALVAAGARKVYAAARSISALGPLVARHGSRVTPLQLDVTSAAQIAAAAATAADVDLLVNNAGIVGFFGGEFTDPKWIDGGRQEMEVNFLGTFAFTHAALRLLRSSQAGRIVNFTTVAVPMRLEGEAIYAASKSAIETFTRIVAREVAPLGITCNAVGPSPIKTQLTGNVGAEKIEKLLARQAIPRWAESSDVANVVDFFLRPESAMITGQIIYLGGVG